MGRAFEFRKARKFKRWGNMARVFTKLGKEITRKTWKELSSVLYQKTSLIIRK